MDRQAKFSLATVFLVVLIDLMGFGIVLPLLPFYAKNFNASPVMVGLLYSVYSFAQLIFSPVWGSFSDRIGRRPIMLISTFGAALAYVMFGLADTLLVLFLSRLVAGIMGGNISTAQAYITDVTPKEERARGMGLIGAAFGIGFVVGPALATALIHDSLHGFLQGNLGLPAVAGWMEANRFALPGFFAAFMSTCSFLLVLFKLPETVDTSKERESVEGVGSRRHSVFTPAFWRQLKTQSRIDAKGLLIPLMIAFFILSFGQSSLYSAFPLFSEAELGMSAEEVGVQFFWIGIIAVVIQGWLIRKLTDRFREEHLFLVGGALMAFGLGLLPLATNAWWLMFFLGIMAVGNSLNIPTMTSMISQEAEEAHVGAVMGTSQGLSGLGRMIGPTWGGFLFDIATGLPFYTTGIILASTVIIGLKVLKKSDRAVESGETDDTSEESPVTEPT